MRQITGALAYDLLLAPDSRGHADGRGVTPPPLPQTARPETSNRDNREFENLPRYLTGARAPARAHTPRAGDQARLSVGDWSLIGAAGAWVLLYGVPLLVGVFR